MRTSLAVALAKHPDTRPENIHGFWLKGRDWLFPEEESKTPKVFISHKHSKEEQVRQFANILSLGFPGGKSRIIIAEDFRKGDDFRAKLREEIRSCHWFVFFLPDRQEDRDWIMTEAGIFEGTQTPMDRLIWISDGEPEDVPQYSHIQKCRYITEDLCKLFTSLFKETPIEDSRIPAINEEFTPQLVEEPLKALLKNYPPETTTEFPQVSTFDIVINEAARETLQCSTEDLMKMEVEKVSPQALHGVFQVDADYDQFEKLVRRVAEGSRGNYWITELASAIKEALAGNITSNIEASFAGVDGRQIYHPFVYSVFRDQSGEQSRLTKVRVAISPGLSPVYEGHGEVDALMAALRYGYRFRFQVIDGFSGPINERGIDEIARLLGHIEGENAFQGGMKEEQLARCFETEEDQSTVKKLFGKWREFRNPTAKDKPGKIDTAISKRDVKMMEEALKEVAPLNKSFVQLGIKRMAHYAEKKW